VDLDDLYLALDHLGTRTISGEFFRHTAPRRDALSGKGAAIYGGRWNRPGTEALYLAAPRETCAAEFARMAEGQGKGPASFLPRTLHTIAVDNLEIVDLTTAGALEAVGLQRSDLEAEDWGVCQQIGDAIDTLGLGGLVADSATGNGVVLTVYVRHTHHGELNLTSSLEVREDFR